MQKSNEYKTAGNFGLLLIGPPKSGKTRLALSFPKPAVLDCDGNLAGAIRAGAGSFVFEDPNRADAASSWKACCDFMKEAIAMDDIDTIVVDGLSIMTNYLIDTLSSHSKLSVGGEKVMDQSLWQPFRNRMQQYMLAGRACDKMFIVTCHEDIIINQATGNVEAYRPLIPGQLKQNLAGLFSDVWRCEAMQRGQNQKFTVRFGPKTFMQIGNSLGIKDLEMDVTNKTPTELWGLLKPYF